MSAVAADCWEHPAVRSGPSDIAGTGLFATAPLAGGAAVARVGGRLVSTAELHELIAATERDPALGYVDSIVVDEDVQLVLPPRSASRFGNHSCDPNLWWTDGYTLSARRDIAEGEELTHDYATSTADPGFLLRCHCESTRCRGMVTGEDWQIPELQARYDGHWVPMLQRRIAAARPQPSLQHVNVEVVAESRTRDLRRAVLRPNLAPGAPLPGDEVTGGAHLAAVEDDGTVLGTCFVYPDPCPWRPERADAWHLRQMATAEGYRGRGIGGAVLGAALAYAAERGARLMWCNARQSAVPFYRRHGFTVHGDVFLPPDHPTPHLRMWQELREPSARPTASTD